MLKNLKFMVFACMAILLFACRKDIGNYEYHSVNELKAFVNVNDTTAYLGQNFKLDPIVTFTEDNDTARYTYTWQYSQNGNQLINFANTRVLNQTMTLSAGLYYFSFVVKDKQTGLSFRKEFNLRVENEINEGFLMMAEVNGKARLDMLSYSTATTQYSLINDLLKSTGSALTLKGNPKSVYCYATGALLGPDQLTYGIYLSTDATTEKIHGDDFHYSPTMNIGYEVFGGISSDFYVQAIRQNTSANAVMIGNDENAYGYSRVYTTYFGSPINSVGTAGALFKVAPFIGTDEVSSALPVMLWDKDNRRFVKYANGGSVCTAMTEQAVASRKFTYNGNTNKELLFMTGISVASPNADCYFVWKETTTNKCYIGGFAINANASAPQRAYAEITATDFDKAENICINPAYLYILYNVGSKVYEYDINTKTTQLMLDRGAEKITLLKFEKYRSGGGRLNPNSNDLIVCSYDPTKPEGQNGKMEIFGVPTLQAPLVSKNLFTGMGKIVSLSYRGR
ncbi:PKD-like family lipoprotein [Pedobacter sp. MW01-1-1]|uniref:PKD-like family lipoprotein n=1 Tax=Pedobacter sp. MW01-1-1 TaxID=3383027 RepID=UPI003FEE506C